MAQMPPTYLLSTSTYSHCYKQYGYLLGLDGRQIQCCISTFLQMLQGLQDASSTLLYVQEPGRRVVIIAAPARQIATIPGRVEYLWHAVKGALNQSCTLIISRSTVTVGFCSSKVLTSIVSREQRGTVGSRGSATLQHSIYHRHGTCSRHPLIYKYKYSRSFRKWKMNKGGYLSTYEPQTFVCFGCIGTLLSIR